MTAFKTREVLTIAVPVVQHYKGRARQVGSIYSLAKRGLSYRVWNRIQRHFRAEFAKLESDASDRVQSERPKDIPGSFKYDGFLDYAFRQTFPPVKWSNQCFGLRLNVSKSYKFVGHFLHWLQHFRNPFWSHIIKKGYRIEIKLKFFSPLNMR